MEEENPGRDALLPLQFVLGSWKGEGRSDGHPVTGSLAAAERFGSFIELRETLRTVTGETDHEDVAWIGYDKLHRKLVVTHFSAGPSLEKMLVIPEPAGFRWWGGVDKPVVRYISRGERLRIEVLPPGEEEAVHWMEYGRAE